MPAARSLTFIRSISALLCAIVILSCGGGDSTGPGGSSVVVSPDTASVALGASVALHASDASGHPISGANVFWSSESPATATVSGSGVVTGIAVGTVRIAASSGGHSGFATITVVPQGVASVRVTPPSAAIKVGETVHLQAEPLDAGGNLLDGRTITWTSSSTAVATVDNDGVVTGVSTGATTITATSEGKSGSSGIAVGAAVPASITVAPPSVSVTTGQTSQLTATVKDANGAVISGAPVAWTVDHPNIAVVSSTGLVTGVAQGSAIVTATSGTVHVDIPVTVTLPPANAVIVSPSSVSLLVTQRQQLTANVTDAGGNTIPNQTVTWQSSDPTIATVGTTGLVIALLPGTATITGTSGAASGTSHVTVSLVPVRRVTVTPDALAFTQGDPGTQVVVALLDSIGGPLSLTGRPVTWSSSKPSVATVSNTGFVTPVGPGQAVITATQTGSGLSATTSVTVTQVPVASVTIAPSLDTLTVGLAVQLTATTKDGSGNTLTGRTIVWDGSDDAIGSVSSTGRVNALTPGTLTVTATSEGKIGTATIVVIAVPVASVTISPTTVSVQVGSATSPFTAIARDASNNVLNGRSFTFASSNSGVATIDPNTGVATGVAPGTTTITATSEGVVSNNATLTVSAIPVASVEISPTTQSVVAGNTTPAFTAVTKDGSGNVLTGRSVVFSSSDANIATVDATTGVATGVAPGSASITATSEGKTSPAATLTVTPAPVGSITISPTSQSVVEGGTTPAFTAVTKDGAGHTVTGRVVTFASSNPAVATINSNSGVATGVDPGSTSITASSEGKTSAPATLTVSAAPVASITISPTTQSVVDGSSTPAFTAVTRDAGGNVLTGRAVTFASSNPGVATINAATGVATGQSPGTSSITASSEGKTSPAATLTVSAVPVASVTLSPISQTVVDGSNTPAFTAVTKDGSGNILTGRAVTFASSNPSVATINASSGVATGQSPGTTSITATSEGKTSNAATLTVSAVPVASVTISPTSQSVVDGASTPAFTVVTRDGSGNVLTGRAISWNSSNTGVATINTSGVATGQAPGTTTITASSEGHTSNAATLTVTAVPVASVAISPTTQSVVDGSSTPAFTAVTRDGGGNVLTGRTVTFASSNPAVATIDANTGVATGQSPGTTSITASSEGQTSPAATLTVTAVPVNNVVVAPSSQNVDVGSTATFVATPRDAANNPLSGRTIVYSSSDPSIATINSSTGVATGVAPGTVTIGALSEGKTGTASLTVNPVPVATVSVAPSSQSIVEGTSTSSPFVATVKDGDGNTLTGRVVTFASSDNSIATVDNSGNATGVAPGTVTITATSEGKSGTASLTVTPVPVASVDISPAIATGTSAGGTIQFTAIPRDAGGNALTGRVITWTSSDPTTATVDANGLMTAIVDGIVTITAHCEGVDSGSTVVTILL